MAPAVEIVTVDEPEPPVTEVGLKLALAPAGRPLAVKDTVPAYPFSGLILAVKLALAPGIMACELGVAEMEKSGGGVTVKVTVVELDRVPLTPLMVSVYVPAAVEVEVETVSVDEPEAPVMEGGLNVGVAPDGNPLTLRLTVPVNPLEGVTVAV